MSLPAHIVTVCEYIISEVPGELLTLTVYSGPKGN
jgi:hypothetical protein